MMFKTLTMLMLLLTATNVMAGHDNDYRCESEMVTARGRVIDTFWDTDDTQRGACYGAKLYCEQALRLRHQQGRNYQA